MACIKPRNPIWESHIIHTKRQQEGALLELKNTKEGWFGFYLHGQKWYDPGKCKEANVPILYLKLGSNWAVMPSIYTPTRMRMRMSSWALCSSLLFWLTNSGFFFFFFYERLWWAASVHLCFAAQILCDFGGPRLAYAKVNAGQIHNPCVKIFTNIWKSE